MALYLARSGKFILATNNQMSNITSNGNKQTIWVNLNQEGDQKRLLDFCEDNNIAKPVETFQVSADNVSWIMAASVSFEGDEIASLIRLQFQVL